MVPVVPCVGNRTKRGFDFIPAAFVIKGASDQGRDEGASLSGTRSAVEIGYKVVIQLYV